MKKRIKKVSTMTVLKYLVRVLGFRVFSQEGSHIKLIQANNINNDVTIPMRKELGQATLDEIFYHVNYPISEFYKWLQK